MIKMLNRQQTPQHHKELGAMQKYSMTECINGAKGSDPHFPRVGRNDSMAEQSKGTLDNPKNKSANQTTRNLVSID